MKTVSIAFRNIFRNTRRSIMTILAISVSALSVLLFGGFISAILYGMQTHIVQSTGHLHVYQRGYFAYGSGNPSAYGIGRHEEIRKFIVEDTKLKDLIEVVTFTLKIYGIAGNFTADASKTFFGLGVVPSDCERMREWNDYGLRSTRHAKLELANHDTEAGIIGTGMARMLRLCEELEVADCASVSPRSDLDSKTTDGKITDSRTTDESDESIPEVSEDFSALMEPEATGMPATGHDKRPRLDLLAATASGAPNVVTLYVNKAENQGVKEMDDSFVAMHMSLAQRLLYGKGERKVTGIVVQLKHTKDIPFVKARLEEIFASQGLDFEIKNFRELSPMYGQVISMFASIFTFLSLIMAVIVLFTIVNTMSMSVLERVNEIGTIRALGVRRGGVLRQFLTEGCLLGTIGATVGSVAAVAAAIAINTGGFSWTPPNNVEPIPLTVQVFENPLLLPATWFGLVLLAVASSFIPARKAGRMTIVDALRHI